jgi:predicted nucleotidyltransferase
MSIPDDDQSAFLKRIAARINEENRGAEKKVRLRKLQAGKEARRLCRLFAAADAGLEKVILYGSLLPGRPFRMDSDIDLALVGGNLATFLSIAESSSFPVDVIPLDEVRSGIRAFIESEGIVLYKRP